MWAPSGICFVSALLFTPEIRLFAFRFPGILASSVVFLSAWTAKRVCLWEERGTERDCIYVPQEYPLTPPLPAKSKKQRRLAAKRLRKEQAMNPELLTPKIPLTEQTIDLPTGDGSLEGAVAAAGARGELTKALRDKRRAGIKEANFLKAMG